ncbi:CDGSH iron-sulfur domain-containing protein [Streptomyces sp. G45]|uniref:CDGSH iron-sulfur domain-containing protein n=1 Tax=Streptomyces sp. G45 TaxID=3406627 RepID=UPI003C20A2B1
MPYEATEPVEEPRREPAEPAGPAEPVEEPRSGARVTRLTARRCGPLMVEGPVEVTLDDGSTVTSDRFQVAVCTCRRSRRYPWCDTSHRRTRGDPGDRP